MAYRNKTYVAFDGDKDIRYYNLMKAWKKNPNITFNFYDSHELNYARDTSSEQQIKSKLKIRMDNSKLFILLVGESTKNLFKFVRWEIDLAIEMGLPIIVVNLNNIKEIDDDLCPLILKNRLAVHVPFKQKIIEHAITHWPEEHRKHILREEIMPRHYKSSLFEMIGFD